MEPTNRVIMLPTKKSQLYKGKDSNNLIASHLPLNLANYEPQHLYIISNDDQIKEGDWVITTISEINIYNKIEQFKGLCDPTYCEKIIASTDNDLTKGWIKDNDPQRLSDHTNFVTMQGLPPIHESFIKAYIKAHNDGKPIIEVQVEYERYNANPYPDESSHYYTGFKVKTHEDGSIIIHQVKSYTKEEVEIILKDFLKFLTKKHNIQQPLGGVGTWIEENL